MKTTRIKNWRLLPMKEAAATTGANHVLLYTTAPGEYDGFGTQTLDADTGRDNRGMVVRLVSVKPEHLDWQQQRYASGLHGYATPEDAKRWPTIWRLN
jgi:hypothetical protein